MQEVLALHLHHFLYLVLIYQSEMFCNELGLFAIISCHRWFLAMNLKDQKWFLPQDR